MIGERTVGVKEIVAQVGEVFVKEKLSPERPNQCLKVSLRQQII